MKPILNLVERILASAKKFRCITATLLVIPVMTVSAQTTATPGSRLEKIVKSGELRVCIWPDYYSITYRNSKTRELSGIDIALSKDLARELKVGLRYVDSSFAQLIDSLLQDRCDIAMHAVGITPQRAERLAFTQPYMRSDIYAVTTKNHPQVKSWADLDQTGRVIAVAAGTVMEPVMQKNLKRAKLLSVRAPATREQEVESGRADAFMADFPYSLRMTDLTDWARVITPPQTFFETDYAWALAPGDKSLLDHANRYLSAIKKDGRLERFAKLNRLEKIVVLK